MSCPRRRPGAEPRLKSGSGIALRAQLSAFADTYFANAYLNTVPSAIWGFGSSFAQLSANDSSSVANKGETSNANAGDKTHGSNSPEDMTIPWIVWGANVKAGTTITAPVTTYDTAATALWLLDLPVPAEWDGKPVESAFVAMDAKK